MKRERMLQVALGLLGLLYVGLIYPLYTDLAHSKWLLEMKDACEPPNAGVLGAIEIFGHGSARRK